MTAAFRGSSKPASTFAQRWSLREVGWVFFWSLQIAQIASPSYRSVYIYMPYKYIQYIDMNEIQSESHSKKTWRSSYHNLEIYLVFSQTFPKHTHETKTRGVLMRFTSPAKTKYSSKSRSFFGGSVEGKKKSHVCWGKYGWWFGAPWFGFLRSLYERDCYLRVPL